jgi:hypothetical protein
VLVNGLLDSDSCENEGESPNPTSGLVTLKKSFPSRSTMFVFVPVVLLIPLVQLEKTFREIIPEDGSAASLTASVVGEKNTQPVMVSGRDVAAGVFTTDLAAATKALLKSLSTGARGRSGARSSGRQRPTAQSR